MGVKQKIKVFVSTTEVSAYTAVSSFNTESIDFTKYSGIWNFTATRSASDGAPTLTVQCSNDGSNWQNYGTTSTGFTLPCRFEDETFTPNYLRFVYTNTGSPTGTITILLYQLP